jgi:hypothetical protein
VHGRSWEGPFRVASMRGAVSLPLPYEELALSLWPVGADVLDNLTRTRILCSDCKIQRFLFITSLSIATEVLRELDENVVSRI